MLRLALVGVDHPHGAHWRQSLGNFADRLRITAVVPAFGGATASLEEKLAGVPRFADVDALVVGGEFDAALVCLPNDEAPSALVKLAAAGKHVLTEKPIGKTAADLDAVIAALRCKKLAFQNGYMWRYDCAAERLREMVRDRRFGRIINVEMLFVTSDIRRRGADHYLFDPAKSGSGFLSWLGVHHLDLLSFVVEQRIVGVTARTGVFGGVATEVEDGGALLLDLEGGGLATFLGGYWLPRWAGENRFTIRGTERWVEWHPTRPGTSGVLEIHGPQPQWHAMEETFSIAADPTPGYGGIRGVRLIDDWLRAIAEGGRDCRNTPESARSVLEILDAAYESSRSGRRIECSIG
jgi:predicted dehydrogenase